MIRVIYTWTVQEGREQAFAEAWRAVTLAIRTTVDGARGSLLLRDPEAPQRFTAIARWTSRDAWQNFQNSSWTDPAVIAHVEVMRGAMTGPRTQAVHDEVDDLTVTD
jgi:heme-degrading monooxygenase HmoA